VGRPTPYIKGAPSDVIYFFSRGTIGWFYKRWPKSCSIASPTTELRPCI